MAQEGDKPGQRVFLGEVWHVPQRPARGDLGEVHLRHFAAGALAVDSEGRILDCGDRERILAAFPEAAVVDYGHRLILPGFVDTHVHAPQVPVIARFGKTLLEWLRTYTFPSECAFSNREYGRAEGEGFFRHLIRQGTTGAAIYATTFGHSAEDLFGLAERFGVRAVIGKVSMDRNGPPELLQGAAEDTRQNRALIERWHGRKGRLFVALTPRFAPSCSEELLEALGRLKSEFPDLRIQTHHNESPDEVRWGRELFPGHSSFLSVLKRHGLLGETTLLGHCIHMEREDFSLLLESRAVAVHCPTSNLFLGSGLFPWEAYPAAARIALGTDVGAGPSLSLWRVLGAAYEVQQLRGNVISPVDLFYLATQGGAEALGWGDQTGSFAPGKWADFQVLDWQRSEWLRRRWEGGESAFERLFALFYLADDRLVDRVYVGGRQIFPFDNQ